MKKINGDRIIQVILLLIIAGGLVLIARVMTPDQSNPYGGYPGAPGGPPRTTAPAPGEESETDNNNDDENKNESKTGKDESAAPSDAMPSGPSSADGRMPRGNPVAETTVAVEAYTVTRKDVRNYIYVNGDIVSDVSVDIYPDIQGELTELSVSLGSHVNKGDRVAIVDPSSPGAIYSASEVQATISGTVTNINADIGDKVGSNTPILTLGDLNQLSIITYIPERYITHLKKGLSAEVSMAAFPEQLFQARVIQLNPVLDSTSRSLETKLEILNPDTRIRAGMFASMKLVTQESRNVLAVPLSALESYYEESVVFVIREDNTIEQRSVITGLSSEEEVEIIEGISENERVVSQGTSMVSDGTKVNVVNSDNLQDN